MNTTSRTHVVTLTVHLDRECTPDEAQSAVSYNLQNRLGSLCTEWSNDDERKDETKPQTFEVKRVAWKSF